jgi:imidazole glycerol-phosphate synthase subunit HisH
MNDTIAIIDYGMGNVFSIQKKLNQLACKSIITNKKEDIATASRIILPGVGHFGRAMENLSKLGLIEVLNESVLHNKKPILGICLGMQLMASFSEEGNVKGLNWFDANVRRFDLKDKVRYKVPHTGWNQIEIAKNSNLMKNLNNDSEFYFVHAYYVECNNSSDILTRTEYEIPFTSAIEKENIVGVQFHPEKSHDYGFQLLKNFISL